MLNERGVPGDGTGDLTGATLALQPATPPPPPWWSMRTGWTSRARPFANAPPSGELQLHLERELAVADEERWSCRRFRNSDLQPGDLPLKR